MRISRPPTRARKSGRQKPLAVLERKFSVSERLTMSWQKGPGQSVKDPIFSS